MTGSNVTDATPSLLVDIFAAVKLRLTNTVLQADVIMQDSAIKEYALRYLEEAVRAAGVLNVLNANPLILKWTVPPGSQNEDSLEDTVIKVLSHTSMLDRVVEIVSALQFEGRELEILQKAYTSALDLMAEIENLSDRKERSLGFEFAEFRSYIDDFVNIGDQDINSLSTDLSVLYRVLTQEVGSWVSKAQFAPFKDRVVAVANAIEALTDVIAYDGASFQEACTASRQKSWAM